MLKKLFKHEWRDSWKMVGGLNIAVLLLSLLSYLTFSKSFMEAIEENEYLSMIFALYNMLYFAAIIALGFATSFFFFYRFYKNLYTDEGYLMHTLPVKTSDLIWSKAFVTVIWIVISNLVIVFSMLNYINSIMVAGGEGSVWSAFGELFAELSMADIPPAYIPMIILIVLIMLISPFYSTFFGYTAISLGQQTKKHKILASIGIYFGLSYAIQIVTSLATLPFTEFMSKVDTMSENTVAIYMNIIFGISLAVIAGVTVLFYFITNKIMKTKLNLE